MVFAKRLREGIQRGRIRCSIRIWTQPHVKVGGRYPMDDGSIVVESIAPMRVADITYDLARESGFETVEDLLRVARHGKGDKVYLIRFHYIPPGGWDIPAWKRGVLAVTFALCTTLNVAAQNPAPPPNPSTVVPPLWSRVLKLPDGRTFVTDGGLAIDAAIAKPTVLPPTVLAPESAKVFAGYLAAAYEQEIGVSDLRLGALKNTFVTPSGIVLSGNYVNFLRRTMPPADIRLRVKSEADPVVIVLDDKAIGVLMPVRR